MTALRSLADITAREIEDILELALDGALDSLLCRPPHTDIEVLMEADALATLPLPLRLQMTGQWREHLTAEGCVQPSLHPDFAAFYNEGGSCLLPCVLIPTRQLFPAVDAHLPLGAIRIFAGFVEYNDRRCVRDSTGVLDYMVEAGFVAAADTDKVLRCQLAALEALVADMSAAALTLGDSPRDPRTHRQLPMQLVEYTVLQGALITERLVPDNHDAFDDGLPVTLVDGTTEYLRCEPGYARHFQDKPLPDCDAREAIALASYPEDPSMEIDGEFIKVLLPLQPEDGLDGSALVLHLPDALVQFSPEHYCDEDEDDEDEDFSHPVSAFEHPILH